MTEQPFRESDISDRADVALCTGFEVQQSADNFWLYGLKTIGIGLALAFVIRTFIAETRYVPSASMEPTLQINDRVLVDKVGYRFHTPQRADIVVFNPTAPLLKLNVRDDLIKRVIGLSGEQVQVKGGQVYINNQPLPEDYIAVKPNYTWGPAIVPPNSYLVLGDNRNQSYDSHYWGFVPSDHIVGRAVVRFWPLNHAGVFPEN